MHAAHTYFAYQCKCREQRGAIGAALITDMASEAALVMNVQHRLVQCSLGANTTRALLTVVVVGVLVLGIWMRDLTLVASELATSGSVIAKQDRISPRSRGSSQCFFCSALPYLPRTSMLPVSGAEQLQASLAALYLPMSSAQNAYS